jgi:predicted metal-dependent peptidase
MQLDAAYLAKINSRLVLEEPFYGYFLLGLPKSTTDLVQRAGLQLFSPHLIQLLVNPEGLKTASNAQQLGLIKKEVLHLLFGHPLLQNSYAQRALFHLAAELAVNQFLSADQLPQNALTLHQFNAAVSEDKPFFEPEKDVAYYYQQLLLWQNLATNSLDHQRSTLLDAINIWAKNGHPAQESYAFWVEIETLAPAEHLVIKHFIKNLIRQAWQRCQSKSAPSTLSPGVLRAVQDTERMPQTPWQNILRQFAASSNSTIIKNTIRRPSKRYGTVPGVRVKRRWELLVAVDTSGSISPALSQLFFNEIHHLWRQGAQLTVVECSDKIGAIYPYRGQQGSAIASGGLTDLTPPIVLANERRPDALIYLTDGVASAPKVKARMPVLWVVPNNEALALSHLPGRKVSIEVAKEK